MILIKKIKRYFETVRFLKKEQIFYQVLNKIKTHMPKTDYQISEKDLFFQHLTFDSPNISTSVLDKEYAFTFLNKEKKFDTKKIDWNFLDYGKLWNYHLNYFEFLNLDQDNFDYKLFLILDYIRNHSSIVAAHEPYPASLRIVSLIKFVSKNRLDHKEIISFIYAQLSYLENNIEFHILGNHILENYFSLFIGGCFFDNNNWVEKGIEGLSKEFHRQILSDGAHFERSVMYQKKIIKKMIDCIRASDQLKKTIKIDAFISMLKFTVENMLTWLQQLRFSNGQFPSFNDSCEKEETSMEDLLMSAKDLRLNVKSFSLGESGYRKFESGLMEITVTTKDMADHYQPGHIHDDLFSFVFHAKKTPFIVDTGISTYETSPRRLYERSCFAHNTVCIDNHSHSNLWKSFRVGKRALSALHVDTPNILSGSVRAHDNSFDFSRKFIKKADKFIIEDIVRKNVSHTCFSNFIFHPDVKISRVEDHEVSFLLTSNDSKVLLSFEKEQPVSTIFEKCYVSLGFNDLVETNRLKVFYYKQLTTTISVI